MAIGVLLLVVLGGCGSGVSQTSRVSTGASANPAGSASSAHSSHKMSPNVPEIVKAQVPGSYQGGPRIVVQEESYDYGEVKLEDWVEAVFHVQNVGDAPLTIIGQPAVRTIEGC